MNPKKTSWPILAVGVFLALLLPAPAKSQSLPFAEPGNWWDRARPGEGLVLERQRSTVAMILFTYTASGEPDFYLASGQLNVAPFPGTPVPLGAETIFVEGALFRFRNGPVLNSDRSYFEGDPPANEAERVGTLRAATEPFSDTLQVWITLDEDKVPEGSQRVTSRSYTKSTFGYGSFGTYVDPAQEVPYQARRACWVDLRGRWVFVDNSDAAARDSWSFNFTELDADPAPQDMICPADSPHTLHYRDTENAASLRCVAKYGQPFGSPDYEANDWRCVLHTDDAEPLLWFSVSDVGARQIIATLGAAPDSYNTFRGPASRSVIGVRLD